MVCCTACASGAAQKLWNISVAAIVNRISASAAWRANRPSSSATPPPSSTAIAPVARAEPNPSAQPLRRPAVALNAITLPTPLYR